MNRNHRRGACMALLLFIGSCLCAGCASPLLDLSGGAEGATLKAMARADEEIYITKVDGKATGSFYWEGNFNTFPDQIRVPPGRHVFGWYVRWKKEIIARGEQAFNADAGATYELKFSHVGHSIVPRVDRVGP